ncbi:hypothetical protein SDJN02_08229, partial [Cucurbita argyrosperma subsp. argyrosperma]
MSTAKQLGKSQANRLAGIKDQLLCMSEVPDGMGLLDSRMNEISAKADRINEMAGRLEAMPVRELMTRVEVLEDEATTVGGFEHRDSLTGFQSAMPQLDHVHYPSDYLTVKTYLGGTPKFLPQSFETAEISKHKEGERIREAEEDEEELKNERIDLTSVAGSGFVTYVGSGSLRAWADARGRWVARLGWECWARMQCWAHIINPGFPGNQCPACAVDTDLGLFEEICVED